MAARKPNCRIYECVRELTPTTSPDYWKCPKHGPVRVARPSAVPEPPVPFTDDEKRDGDDRKRAALDGHEDRHPSRLEAARAYARTIAATREVTADDVRAWADENDVPRGPWMGGVFRGDDWEHVGWTTSRDPKQHGTGLRVWRLRS